MQLIRGDARLEVPRLEPKWIITDAPTKELEWLIRYAEKHDCVVIDSYSRNWLVEGGMPGEKRWQAFASIVTAAPHNATICDPYMGCGAIGIAAINYGYDFIGIERDRQKFEIATERLNAAQDAKTRSSLPGISADDFQEGAV